MPLTDLRPTILHLLQNPTFENIKRLFWTELNYSQVNRPLSRMGWPDAEANSLADDPLLLAAGGSAGGFHIIYSRLASNQLLLGAERPVITRLLREHPYALFIFSDATRNHWHFVNVKDDKDNRKRNIYRRITIAQEEGLRTAAERISLLDIETIQRDLFGLSPFVIQTRHDEAFDVEKVTHDFYGEYAEIFEFVKAELRVSRDARKRLTDETRHEFTQRLMNRLLFLAFLQKKKWLNGKTSYLFELFDTCEEIGRNFYDDYLFYLLFAGLNNPDHAPPEGMTKKELDHRIGDVPFLNGGLFEQFDEWDVRGRLEIGNDIFDKVLGEEGLFRRYNFTITESTPFDIEVAIDPEMLGKIFEELVTGRHESGSYYTPKPVVSFMCREALKGYLTTALPSQKRAALEKFVDEENPAHITDPERVLEALRNVKACDPACGSGAYLLGLLHELLDLRAALFTVKQIDSDTVYDRKLEIIQKNLYGVDKDEFAVNIARLRLWLSLIVDFEGAVPPPLPNLNYKIEAGDSLTSPDPSGGLEVGFRRQLVNDFVEKKNEFINPHPTRKLKLYAEIEQLRAEIKLWSGRAAHADDFDWTVEFAEIFIELTPTTTVLGKMAGVVNETQGQMELAAVPEGEIGFDIVLANPPYVRADAQFKHIEKEDKRQQQIERWKAYRNQLKNSKIYDTLYEKWDLYIPFLERAFQLLHPRGQMVFIIPDAYNAAKYASESHQFFLTNTRIERIDFCSEINLFNAGVNNTILHFAKGKPTAAHKPTRVRRWGKREEFDENGETLYSKPQIEFGESLFKLDGTTTESLDAFVPLQRMVYISYGLRANADDRFWKGEFVTEDLVSDVKDSAHPKPFVEGKDLVKWCIKRVRYLEWGTKRAPKKFARPTFPELHETKPKLISLVVSGSPPVVYDDKGHFTTHTSCIFVHWHSLKGVVNKSISKTSKYRRQDPFGDREAREEISKHFHLKYILAIMNSSFAREWLKGKRRSKMHIYPDDWKQLPIAPISLQEQKPLVECVDQILREYEIHGYPLPAASAKKVAEWEHELDLMVEKLYKA